MSSLKLCHISDLHLGYRKFGKLTKGGQNQREADVNAAFREAVSRIIELKPDVVIVSGDVFHTVRPSNAVLTFAFREFSRLSQAVKSPIIICAGNHESPKRQDTGSALRLLSEIENIYVADAESIGFEFENINLFVQCLPHSALYKFPELSLRAKDAFRFNVLVTHAQVDPTIETDFGGALIPIEELRPYEWDYIALGHVHEARAVVKNAWYAGAIEYTSTNIWAEPIAHGFLEVELPELSVKLHPLSTPRMVKSLGSIDASNLNSEDLMASIADRLQEVPGSIAGKILRLQILNVTREVHRQLDHKQIRIWKGEALHLQLDFRHSKVESSHIEKVKGSSLIDELCTFAKNSELNFAEANELDGVFRAYMLSLDKSEEERE